MRDHDFLLEDYIQASVEKLEIATNSQSQEWGFGEEKAWTLDQDSGILNLEYFDSKVVHVPAQIIGTYNSEDEAFIWAWGNSSIDLELKTSSQLVKDFGEKHDLQELTTEKIFDEEHRIWQLTALAYYLSDAYGAYRGPISDSMHVFMTFGKIKSEGEI